MFWKQNTFEHHTGLKGLVFFASVLMEHFLNLDSYIMYERWLESDVYSSFKLCAFENKF